MADNKIYFQAQPWILVDHRSAPDAKRLGHHVGSANGQADFARILEQEASSVKFSQHAVTRMQSRNLRLDEQDLRKLNEAVEKIARKGARESLVYLNDIAFVVSVKNKTVITAMDGSSAKENIFTNIDSAVIL